MQCLPVIDLLEIHARNIPNRIKIVSPPLIIPLVPRFFRFSIFLYFVTPACIRKTYCYIIVCTTISRVCKKLYLIKKKKFCIYSLAKNVFENKFSSMHVSYNSILTCNDGKEKRRIYFTSKYTYSGRLIPFDRRIRRDIVLRVVEDYTCYTHIQPSSRLTP